MTPPIVNQWQALKCFIPGNEAFCVCFIRGIWCIKKSLWQAKCFILWYHAVPTFDEDTKNLYLSPPEIDTWKSQNLLNQRKNQPIRCFHKKIRTRSLAILHDIWGSSRILKTIVFVLHNFIESVALIFSQILP